MSRARDIANLQSSKITADAGIDIDNITLEDNDISTTNSNGNLTITPNGTGDLQVNSDRLTVRATEGESATLLLASDEQDDGGDTWKVTANTDNTFVIQNDVSGSSDVTHFSITPHATVANSTVAIAGGATVGGTLGVTGVVTANAGVVVDNITIDGNEIDVSSGDLTLDVAGDLILDSDAPNWRMKDNGTSILEIGSVSSGASFYNAVSNADMYFKGNDGGSPVTALTLDMGDLGKALFNSGLSISSNDMPNVAAASIYQDSSNRLRITGGTAGYLFMDDTNGTTHLKINADGDVFLGSGTDAGYGPLQIGSTSTASTVLQMLAADDGYNTIHFGDGTSGTARYRGYVQYNMADEALMFATGATERMRIGSTGRVSIGTASPVSPATHNARLAIEGTDYHSSTVSISANSNNGNGAYLMFSKSRGTSVGATTVVQDGDTMGYLGFCAADGIDVASVGAAIYAQVDGSPGNDDTPGRLFFATTADDANGVTNRMLIDSDGFVVIGKSSASATTTGVEFGPAGDATVTKSSGNTYYLNDTSANKFYVNANGGIYNYQSNDSNLSDEREKKNITSLGSKWNAVKKWSLKEFHYNADADSDNKKCGVIAQDIEDDHPELVTEFDLTDTTKRKAVKEQQITWMAIKALQEAMAKIETLEAKVAKLEE